MDASLQVRTLLSTFEALGRIAGKLCVKAPPANAGLHLCVAKQQALQRAQGARCAQEIHVVVTAGDEPRADSNRIPKIPHRRSPENEFVNLSSWLRLLLAIHGTPYGTYTKVKHPSQLPRQEGSAAEA